MTILFITIIYTLYTLVYIYIVYIYMCISVYIYICIYFYKRLKPCSFVEISTISFIRKLIVMRKISLIFVGSEY